jgi:hypothetical protein
MVYSYDTFTRVLDNPESYGFTTDDVGKKEARFGAMIFIPLLPCMILLQMTLQGFWIINQLLTGRNRDVQRFMYCSNFIIFRQHISFQNEAGRPIIKAENPVANLDKLVGDEESWAKCLITSSDI